MLGDVTAEQLRSLDPEATGEDREAGRRGAGLMVLGGYVNLGNGGWQGTALEKLLPVDLSMNGAERGRRVERGADGGRPAAGAVHPPAGRRPEPAEGVGEAGEARRHDGADSCPRSRPRRRCWRADDEQKGEPILVMQPYGGGREGRRRRARVLVFGGDTTLPLGAQRGGPAAARRFWRQVVVWLARQEDAEGSVWVRPDVRRLPVRASWASRSACAARAAGPTSATASTRSEVTGPGRQQDARAADCAARRRTAARSRATQAPGVYKIVVQRRGQGPVRRRASAARRRRG